MNNDKVPQFIRNLYPDKSNDEILKLIPEETKKLLREWDDYWNRTTYHINGAPYVPYDMTHDTSLPAIDPVKLLKQGIPPSLVWNGLRENGFSRDNMAGFKGDVAQISTKPV